MINANNPKLNLSPEVRRNLRKAKIKISEILDQSPDEIEVILEATSDRVKMILALAEFQKAPSIGIKFAEDLIFLGYYSLSELEDKDGAQLMEDLEHKKGYWIDPCVEDQFRLIVDFAKNPLTTRKWWDFTEVRKSYRLEHGYPDNRPTKAWHEVVSIKKKIPK